MDEKLKNIIWLAISVGVMFTGYFTMAGTSETIIRAYNERTGDNVSSFVSFGILSVANAIGCFFVSPVVAMIGRKNTYFIGGILQTAYIVTYVNPQPTVLYVMSVIGEGGQQFYLRGGV
jgi:Na+/melibiose symporter-like transporter